MDFISHERAVILNLFHHRRIRQSAAGVEVGLETRHTVGKDLDVAFPTPFAIGEFVQAGQLLQAQNRFNGRVK